MKPRSLKDALKGKLTAKETEQLVTAFDVIGKIAVIDIPPGLEKKKKVIGEALLSVHHNLKTVCKRAGIHGTEFRIRPVEVIAGEKSTEAEYIESGVKLRLDINRVYFTPRLSHERERIAALVRPGETVGVFFAGVGPFALVIFKRQPRVRIYAIELNPAAYEYMVTNIRINKAQEAVTPILGDVREVAPKLGRIFDRIAMPLPKGGEDFLEAAFAAAKPGCVVHFYQFAKEEDPFSEAEEKVRKAAEKAKRSFSVVNKKIVRPYAPRIAQVVLDVKVG
jgi:tRNA (guanine37-N1)-methyltransferase